MKRFLRKPFNSKLGVFFRNISGFRPPTFLYNFEKSHIASDLFIWRTDNGYETIFKATDILQKFYGIESFLKIVFYDCTGSNLRELAIDFKDGLASFTINKNTMDLEAFGTFCVFNCPKRRSLNELNVTNKCYVGYGRNSAFSMVHGNIVALMARPNQCGDELVASIVPSVNARKGDYTYWVQKKIDSDAVTTFWFSNPLNRDIRVSVNGHDQVIKPRGCGMITVDCSLSEGVARVVSDFIFPRPLVMCENGAFLDCHHG